MPYITLDDEQARLIRESVERVEIRDRSGNRLGFISSGAAPEEIAIAEARKNSNQPRFTTDEVLKHLESLER